MTTKIHRLPGHGHIAREQVPLKFVALCNVKIGDELLAPGTELTPEDLSDRNIGAMLRNRQIQQVIEATESAKKAKR